MSLLTVGGRPQLLFQNVHMNLNRSLWFHSYVYVVSPVSLFMICIDLLKLMILCDESNSQ